MSPDSWSTEPPAAVRAPEYRLYLLLTDKGTNLLEVWLSTRSAPP